MVYQVYELRVRGPVPAELLHELGAEDLGEEPPLTILRTEATDQSGLHGMLQRLSSLGLELLEVRLAVPADREDGAENDGAEDDRAEDDGLEEDEVEEA